MNLSNGEKLILAMLCEIYQHIGIENEIDPKFVQSAICSGNTWGLEWKYPGIFHDSETSPEIVTEVVNYLDMWTFIEISYERLTQEEKNRVEIEAEPFGKHVKFPGFDGNNESEYLGVARFLIDDLERFTDFKGRDLNSHCPLVEAYRRMYSLFHQMQASLHNGMDVVQIVELLKAKRYPDD